jgi:PIN domain nuclease of toxin-antitoxin system
MAGIERVLDTSAALALIYGEPGGEKVRAALPAAAMSSVNVSELLAVLMRDGFSEAQSMRMFQRLGLAVRDFAVGDAAVAARFHTIRAEARRISLGDRACLAAACALGVPAMTSDRNWRGLDLGVRVEFIR